MVFKAYENDLDGITNKLGFSKRTFAEWSTQVNDAFASAGKGLNGFKNAIQVAFIMPKQTITPISEDSFSSVFNTKNSDSFFNNFNTNVSTSTDILDKWCAELKVSDETMKKYLLQCLDQDCEASFTGYCQYVEQANAANSKFTLGTKVASLGMKALSIAGNMLLSYVISKLVSGMIQLAQVSDDVAKKAKELGSSFGEAKTDIESYKSRIEDLYNTINDNSSSVEEVANAREELLLVQDELIDKFGKEKESIDLITQSIYGQVDALDKLTEKQWQEKLNEFDNAGLINKIGNSAGGYDSNVDRMMDEYGDYSVSLDLEQLKRKLSKEDFSELSAELEKIGADVTQDVTSATVAILSGTASEVYDKILEIQGLSDEFDFGDRLSSQLVKFANAAKESVDEYEQFYNQYLLYEKIFPDEKNASAFNSINNAKKVYEDAFASGDEEQINKAIENFSNVFNTAVSNIDDKNVIDYFNNLYPDLMAIVESWEFKTNIVADIDTSSFDGKTKNNIYAMLTSEGEDEAEKVFNKIKENAISEGLIDDTTDGVIKLLDLLVEWGVLQEDVTKKVEETSSAYSRASMISDLNDMSEGFEELDKIYASIKDKNPFDFKLLDDENFKNTFSGLGQVYEDFIEQITSTPDDINACKSAFNNLVSEWIESTGVLNNVNDENASLTTSMLKQMGVTNANVIVQQKLTENKWKDSLASRDLANATNAEISALIAEAEASGISKAAIYDLISAKLTLNTTKLNFRSQINSLYQLAIALGVTADAANATITALRNEEKINRYDARDGGKLATEADKVAFVSNDLQNQIKAKFGSIGTIDIGVNYGGGSTSNKSSSSGSSSKDTEESFDWIERAIKKVQRTIDNLSKTVATTYKKWTTRNTALKDQITAINSEISTQQKAYDYYMKKANSLGLSSTYVNKIKDGSISIETLTNESTIKKIQEYQELYDKALEAKDAITDLKDEIASLAKEKFDNVSAEYEDKLSIIEHEIEMLESSIDMAESRGYIVSQKYYEELIKQEQSNISTLTAQYNTLKKNLESDLKLGNIEQYSSDWYEMVNSILDVESAIQDANSAVIEYQNSMRDLEWEIFDKMQELFSNIQSETDFYIDLMSNKKLVDENGAFTDQGQATLGLHAVNFNSYMAQADKYAEEIAKINAELANDPNNQTLLERRIELEEAQRDLISSAEDEKQAIKSLYEEGYNGLLDSLSELIDKRKELLSVTEDLYDYEKNVAEQTKEIARLEKIMASFAGNDSEEAKTAIQKYKVELEEAKTNLEETEREKYIQDQEKMLDNLQSETEEWINQRLDNIDALISSAIESTNANSDSIRETLETEAENVGLTFTENMNSIWGESGSFTSIVSEYGNGFTSQLTTVNGTLANIQNYVASIVGASDKEANTTIKDISSSTDSVTSITAPPASSSGSNSSGSSSSSNSSSSSSASSASKPKVSAVTATLKEGSRGSDVGKLQKALNMIQNAGLKEDNIFGPKTKAAVKTFQKNQKISSDGIVGKNTKAKFKALGYAKGSERIDKEQIAITNEAGQEIIYRAADGSILTPLRPGDKVFENEAVQRLWEMSHNPEFFDAMVNNTSIPSLKDSIGGKASLHNISNISNVMSNNMSGDMNFYIEMNEINDPQQFAVQLKHELLYNPDVNKMVQNVAFSKAMGKNSLGKFNYR